LVEVKDPVLVNNLLNPQDYTNLIGSLKNPKSFGFDPGFSRYAIGEGGLPILGEFANKLTQTARKIFNSETLMPTYTLFVHYEGQDPAPSLYKHKDDNACTYTLDMCVYQNEPWDLWVEDKNYCLYPNQALAYYGNEQLHWREKFPNPETNHVAMIFFHFAEPDHWYFTKGPNYLEVIRNQISEKNWMEKNT
jgi:hypothetical protein